MTDPAPVLLELRGIRKRFGELVAVDDVDLELRAGEIHALCGENGAGKSTLAAIAFGALPPDAGSVTAHGTVGLVHQHFELVERLRVWENVLLGREPRRRWAIDVDAARERVRALAAAHGLEVDPDERVENLPVGIRQRVELLRELEREPAVLLLDEPTAALAPTEIAAFFGTVVALARGGAAVLVVTHKLQEVIDYSERVTVMRAGRIVARALTAETTADAIARAMVGGELPALAARAPTVPLPRLRLDGVCAGSGAGALHDATFSVAAGEIVGVVGVEGNGQAALADALAGTVPHAGTIAIDGTVLPSGAIAARAACGLGMIPADRSTEALVLSWTIAENVALGRHRDAPLRHGVGLDPTATTAAARAVIAAFDVRPPDPHAIVGSLSGGNQQKVVVGRTLAAAPRVVIAVGPTRGIDVAAATLVQSRLIEARNGGAAVLIISFDLEELFALADRIVVVFGGRIVGEFPRERIERARVGALMTGNA